MLNTDDTGYPFSIAYPEDSDAPDGPSQMQSIAESTADYLWAAGAENDVSVVTGAQAIAGGGGYAALGTPDRCTLQIKENSLIIVSFRCEVQANATWNGTTKVGARLYIDGNPMPGPIKDSYVQAYPDDFPANAFTGGYPIYTDPGIEANNGTNSMMTANAPDFAFGENLTRGGGEVSFFWPLADDTVDIEARYKRDGAAAVNAKNRILTARVIAPKPA
jgi:hypothetical protein